jgi:hypothetical protein
MKHNKKRNTAFLYECLIREGTKATFEKNSEKAIHVKTIILEHFNKNSELTKELNLYKSIKENFVEEKIAEKYLNELKSRYDKLDKIKLFNEQTSLINKINKTLGQNLYNNFIPNYKDLATVYQVFANETTVKEKILLEQNILNKIKKSNEENKNNLLEHSDNLLFKTFSQKFNQKYDSLLKEQKTLLSKYVSSFNENSLDFKIFLNEEVSRIKKKLQEALELEEIKSDENMVAKTNQTIEFLDNFKEVKEISNDMLQKILKIQQFVSEVDK